MCRERIPSDMADASSLLIVQVHREEQRQWLGLRFQHQLLLALKLDDAVCVSKHIRADVELKALFGLLDVDQFRRVCDADSFDSERVIHVQP